MPLSKSAAHAVLDARDHHRASSHLHAAAAEGRIFAPMAYTVVSALVLAAVLAHARATPFVVPPRPNTREEDNLIVRICKQVYQPVCGLPSSAEPRVLVTAVVCWLGSLAFVPLLGTEFLPKLNEGAVWINIMLPPGISVARRPVNSPRRAMLRGAPGGGVGRVQGGPARGRNRSKMINMAEFLVDVKPQSEWRRGLSNDQLIDRMTRCCRPSPHRAASAASLGQVP